MLQEFLFHVFLSSFQIELCSTEYAKRIGGRWQQSRIFACLDASLLFSTIFHIDRRSPIVINLKYIALLADTLLERTAGRGVDAAYLCTPRAPYAQRGVST